jgi:hypothetical protein
LHEFKEMCVYVRTSMTDRRNPDVSPLATTTASSSAATCRTKATGELLVLGEACRAGGLRLESWRLVLAPRPWGRRFHPRITPKMLIDASTTMVAKGCVWQDSDCGCAGRADSARELKPF